MWSLISGELFGARGEILGPGPDSRAYAVFWDGDLLREVVENGVVAKYEPATGLTTSIATGVEENYAERFVGDLFGDWREELIYTLPGEMRIYTTTSSAKRRLYTFMHDPLYRNGIAMSASGWLPNGHPGFFVGASMAPPPRPNLQLTPLDFSSTDKK
jgi:rhamnogalacturonan endolyase